MTLDDFDIAILHALQKDGSLTNSALSDVAHLSPSQCSRRRSALEKAGLIRGYGARLDAARLGFGFRAIVRVNLQSHGGERDSDFAEFVGRQSAVQSAFSVSGDADYVLDVLSRDLESFASFIHDTLLPHPQVAQVRSDIVLKTLKDRAGIDLLS